MKSIIVSYEIHHLLNGSWARIYSDISGIDEAERLQNVFFDGSGADASRIYRVKKEMVLNELTKD